MTFDTLERSRWSGRPIALLELTRGALVLRYTDFDRAIEVDGHEYVPLGPKRSEISDTGERAKGVLTIELPLLDALGTVPDFVAWFYPIKRTAVIGVVWKSKHYGDAQVATEWIGRVISRARNDTTVFLSCEQRSSRARSVGQNLCVMRGCPYAVYSDLCGLLPEDFAIPATLSAVDGTGLTSADFGASALALDGGFIEWTAPDGEIESRSILSQAGDEIEIDYATDLLEAADEATAYPGCAGDWEACEARGNSDNYGGAPNLPVKNPYDGNPR